jgi:hypothetical protein
MRFIQLAGHAARYSFLGLLLGLFATSAALADKGYRAVPAEAAAHGEKVDANAKLAATGLQLKAVSYDGSVNGELTVEVKNTSKTAQTFIATGLYFVPQGDADEAPQRLGAVGPMQIAGEDGEQRVEKLVIPPGQAMKVKLDVFCIDSHRPAPTSENKFSLGSKRLPAKLRTTIETRSKAAVEESGGYAAPAAKSRIQSEVWGARDADWVKIDGEGKQEVEKQSGGGRRPGPQRVLRHPQRDVEQQRIKEPMPIE